MGVPGRTQGTMFTPVPLELMYHDPERVGGALCRVGQNMDLLYIFNCRLEHKVKLDMQMWMFMPGSLVTLFLLLQILTVSTTDIVKLCGFDTCYSWLRLSVVIYVWLLDTLI